jgi:Mg-chelatase subunit ChlD
MRIKKIISVIAIASLTLSLVSCGPSKEAEINTSDDTTIEGDVNSTTEESELYDDKAKTETKAEAPVMEKAASDAEEAADAGEAFGADGPAEDGVGADDSAPAADSKSLARDSSETIKADSDSETVSDVDAPPVDEPVAEPPEEDAKAGVLTAGRWNDNDNWGFFTNLVNNETITFPSYGVDPRNRFAVTVKNSDGKTVPNTAVTLTSEDGKEIWSSVTDKKGIAYLFYTDSDNPASVSVTNSAGKTDSYRINVSSKTNNDGKDKKKGGGNDNNQNTVTASDSSIDITIDDKPSSYKKMDIMFIMDATGSMTDEMTFLQKDFSKIAKETNNDNNRYSVNFYRDEGDDYVTKCFDFTKKIDDLQKNLNAQTADGGGDIPEAVHTILDESINKSSWREDSVKLAFLIYDAPPHDGDDISKSLIESVKKASKMGIHLIPVVSSNAERETELFGRAIAICTNSDYVFLTDDSGVGGSHLEPIIGDYDVEPLYDIIVKIIDEYSQK